MLTFRSCEIDEGPRIGRFVASIPDPCVEPHRVEVDWSAPVYTWLVAEDEYGALRGVVALALTPPFGIFEHLTICPGIRQSTKAKVASGLVETGYTILRNLGIQAAVCFIPDAHSYWSDVLKKRGARVAYRGEVLVRGL